MSDLLTMSKKELTRLEVIQRIEKKTFEQREAVEILGISVRHVKRLLRAYRQAGAEGLISNRLGTFTKSISQPHFWVLRQRIYHRKHITNYTIDKDVIHIAGLRKLLYSKVILY